jgi:hypothetical protein
MRLISVCLPVMFVVLIQPCTSQVDESQRVNLYEVQTLPFLSRLSQVSIVEMSPLGSLLSVYDGSSSVVMIDTSNALSYRWQPGHPHLTRALIFGIRTRSWDAFECLATSTYGSTEVFRYVVERGIAIDSAVVPIDKPVHHALHTVQMERDLLVALAKVSTVDHDSMFLYMVDTAAHSTIAVPIPPLAGTIAYSTALVTVVDASVAIVLREDLSRGRTRVRLLGVHIQSGNIWKDTLIDDAGEHKADIQFLWKNDHSGQFHVAGNYSDFVESTISFRVWTIGKDLSTIDVQRSSLPPHTTQRLYGGLWIDNDTYTLCGRLRDYDPFTFQIDESSSRGVLLTFNATGRLERYQSMGDQRPTQLFDIAANGSRLLVAGADVGAAPFIAQIDIPSSVESTLPSAHPFMEKNIISFHDLLGGSVGEPSNGCFILVWNCPHGCMHSSKALYQDGKIIANSSNWNPARILPVPSYPSHHTWPDDRGSRR